MNFKEIFLDKNTKFITNGIFVIFIFTVVFSIINFITTYMFEIKNSNSYDPIILTNSGLIQIYRSYSLSFIIFKFSAGLIVLFTTISAMIIALHNYISISKTNLSIIESNEKNSQLNNETSKINFFNHQQNHRKLFFEFIKDYLEVNQKIHSSTLNSYLLYTKIFYLSDDKKILLSAEFNNLYNSISNLISDNNNLFQKGRQHHFSFKTYQNTSIKILEPFGIFLSTCFRREFFDIEGEILSLIDEIQYIYGDRKVLPDRKYI